MKNPALLFTRSGINLSSAGVVAGLHRNREVLQTAPAGIVSHNPFQTGIARRNPFMGGARTLRQFRTLQIRATVTHRTRSVGQQCQAIRAEADRGLGHRVRVHFVKENNNCL